jgi:predicted ABC-type ATPase
MEAGYCTRPFICVPNQTYKQWLAEGKGLLPDVKFNDLYNLSKDYIDDLKGPNGEIVPVDEYSISVMTYEGLEQIGFSEGTANSLLFEMHDILDQGDVQKSFKKQAKEQSALMERLQMLIGRGLKGTRLNIEDLGFDFACYDEAHKMKKVFVAVKGEMDEDGEREKNPYKIQAGGQPSSIALKGFMLSQYILRNNNNRNILLLTATPFTNSPLEVFSMLTFIAYKQLKETNLNNLKSFFDTYVNASNELVINAKLKPERKQVVMGFNNLRSLQQLIFRFINYKTGESVNVKRPNKYVLPYTKKVIDGEVIAIAPEEQILTQLPLSAQQANMMADIKAYAEGKVDLNAICSVNTNSDKLNESVDDEEITVDATEGVELDENTLNDDEKAGVRTLRSMSHARNLALSPYLYECSGLGKPDHKSYIESSPKLSYVIGCIKSVKNWHEKNNTPVSGQVIYMDRGIEYFELIRQYLIKEVGYLEHEVGIIKSQMPGGKDAKEKVKMKFLGEAYNSITGEVESIPDEDRMKIVIGSSTIKEGINLQKHSTILYNCFVDWNPTDIKQLEGRIWRQGNLFKNVRIVTPLMEDSMDIFIFQKLQEKTSRIAQLLEKDEDSNTFKLEEFNPSEIKAALVSDPYVLAEMELMEDKEKIADEIRGLKNEQTKIEKIIEAKDVYDSNIEEFREFVEKYRPNKSKEPRSYMALLSAAQDVLKKQTDAEGLPMEYPYAQKPNVKYSTERPVSKQYYHDNLMLANRTLNKAEKEYLTPKGLSIGKLPKYKDSLTQKVEELEEISKATLSDEAIKNRAEIIILKREREKIEPASVEQRVKQFETLNYLLADKKQIDIQAPKATCPPVDASGKLRTDKEAIEELTICISTNPETKQMHTNKKGEYTPERMELHQNIINEVKKDVICISQEKPIAILTGGAPGSGKTHFLKNFAPYLLGPELFKIDADEIRAKLPEYTGWNSANTHQETRDIVNTLIDDIGKNCKYDLIYDGTMNKAKKYFELINKLKNTGYDIYIIYIKVPKEISEQRVLERYQRSGRFVPPDVLQEVYDNGDLAFNEIKNMVKGYILVDGVSGKIIEKGGEVIPTDRNYAQLSTTTDFTPQPQKQDYQQAIEGLQVLMELAETEAEKLQYLEVIDGLNVLIELA